MPEAIKRQEAGQQDLTPAVARTAGEVIQLDDGRAAVVVSDLAIGEKGSVYYAGIFDVAAATGVTFAIGEEVFWDASANTAINSESSDLADFAIGTAVAAKVSGVLVVRVDLNVPRSRMQKVLRISAAKTLTKADLGSTVYADTQGGAFTVTLPAAADCKGQSLTFVRTGTGTNALTLDGNASETVDGGATLATLDAARDTVTIESDGSNWFVIAARIA